MKFIVADFSAIEARVIAWLAGEEWRMKAFANGEDIYCASASKMFGVPVVKHGENGQLRQKGKISELACGFGGSVGAMKAMGGSEMSDAELKQIVTDWRTASPHIVQLWWDVEMRPSKLCGIKPKQRPTAFTSLMNLVFCLSSCCPADGWHMSSHASVKIALAVILSPMRALARAESGNVWKLTPASWSKTLFRQPHGICSSIPCRHYHNTSLSVIFTMK